MSARPRYVFDTNVIVSAILFQQSAPGRALVAALGRGQILLSRETLVELSEVLARPKFERYLTREEREEFLVKLVNAAFVVEVTQKIRACRDAKDDKFLELVADGQANCLVSGDADLLALHPFHGVPILTPAQFLDSLTGGQ